MNRCPSINKNNRRCRSKLKNDSLFCCSKHEPINNEIIKDGCFLCMEKIENPNDILFFKCKHAFHKPCYIDWLNYSTYSDKICMICRNNIYSEKNIKIEFNNKKIDNTQLINLNNIISIKNNDEDSVSNFFYKEDLYDMNDIFFKKFCKPYNNSDKKNFFISNTPDHSPPPSTIRKKINLKHDLCLDKKIFSEMEMKEINESLI